MEMKHVVTCSPDEHSLGPVFCHSPEVAQSISDFLAGIYDAERFYIETAYYFHQTSEVGQEMAKRLLREYPANIASSPDECWRREWRRSFSDFLDDWHIDQKVWRPREESPINSDYEEWARTVESRCAEALMLVTLQISETELRLERSNATYMN